MKNDSEPEAYLIHVWIRRIHPMLWRRFLVSSKCTLADLHFVLQIGFGWTDFYLHRFRIHKKDYAVPRLCGIACAHDAREVKLADLHFRTNERFLYEYNFGDLWQLQVRIEQRSAIEPRRPYPICVAGCWAGPPEGREKNIYPVCIAGACASPPEDCGGPEAYMEQMDHHRWNPPLIQSDNGQVNVAQEVAQLDRATLRLETVGLSLAEARSD